MATTNILSTRQGRGPATSWVTGSDPRRRDQYYGWMKHKAQAKFRSEPHELTFDEWESIWNHAGAWEQRGRSLDSLCLTRKNVQQAWSNENCEIITRQEQLDRQGHERRGAQYKPRTKIRSDRGTKRTSYTRKK